MADFESQGNHLTFHVSACDTMFLCSLAALMICTILLMFVTARLFVKEVDYYELLNMQLQNNDTGSR